MEADLIVPGSRVPLEIVVAQVRKNKRRSVESESSQFPQKNASLV